MEPENPSLIRIFEEEILGNLVLSRWYYPAYIRTLGLAGHERVLEFGSGGGLMSRALAHALSPDGSLTCVDISEYWTGKAKRRLKSFSNIRFLPGDITQMDLPAASFDAAVIHYALHDIEPGARGDVMDAIAETLRPEGSLFIREPGHPSHGIPLPEIRNLTLCAGFRELHAGCKRSLIWRSVCNGQFLKSW